MGWIKNLFRKREVIKEEVFIDEARPDRINHECFCCKKPILSGERWSKHQGRWFHKKCYKKMISENS